MTSKTTHIANLAKAIGWRKTAEILGRRAAGLVSPVWVAASGVRLKIRPCDSDLFVAGQIFGAQEYDLAKDWVSLNRLAASWSAQGGQPVILDVGANVGYSAIYFASRCPDAIVVAVEADRPTYDFMCENIAGNDRIIPIHAAVWSHEDGVNFGPTSDLGSWAGRVDNGSGATPSKLLSSVYAAIPSAKVLLVKLDVEGAEREICASAFEVLKFVPAIMVEPHDFMLPGEACLSPLFSVLAGRKMDTLLRGENLLFLDSGLRTGAA